METPRVWTDGVGDAPRASIGERNKVGRTANVGAHANQALIEASHYMDGPTHSVERCEAKETDRDGIVFSALTRDLVSPGGIRDLPNQAQTDVGTHRVEFRLRGSDNAGISARLSASPVSCDEAI
jgi:hypothetical protein